MRIRAKVWLEEDGRMIYGQGRQVILEAIDREGSLAAAARALEMSYRAAWGRLKASEDILGYPLMERGPDGRRSGGLTPQAKELVRDYRRLKEDVNRLLKEAEEKWTGFAPPAE